MLVISSDVYHYKIGNVQEAEKKLETARGHFTYNTVLRNLIDVFGE